MKTFQGHGISFQYMPTWEFTREIGVDRIDLSVLGPGTAIWVVSLIQHRANLEELVNEAVSSFVDEYGTCDIYPSDESICLLPTVGKDIDFFHQDLITRVSIRACEGEAESILLVYQLADVDKDESFDILKAMTDSLVLESYDQTDDELDDTDIPAFHFHNLFANPDELATSLIENPSDDEDLDAVEQIDRLLNETMPDPGGDEEA